MLLVIKMKRYLRIYKHLIKFAAIQETAYRGSFFLEIFVELAYIVVSVLLIRVVFWNIKEVAGWNFNKILVLMGVNVLFQETLLGLVFIFNLRSLPEKIAKGELDLILTKPLDSLFVCSLWRPYFAFVPSLIPGFILIYLGFRSEGLIFNPINLLPFIIILFCGWIIAFSVGVILSSLSFWLINADPLPNLAEELTFMAAKPYSIFSGIFRFFFLVILPLAFMVSFPAQSLLGETKLWWIFMAVGLAALFLIITKLFWNFALKHYSSASS